MNYLEWNNAIVKHFFNERNDEKEVILYFSEAIIEEIGENNFKKPENGYIEDFYKALRRGVPGVINTNFIRRIIAINEIKLNGRHIENVPVIYPPYLAYLLCFILPFTSGESHREYSASNFHDIAKIFFQEKNLSKNYDQHIKYDLKKIDSIWEELRRYLIDKNNFTLGYIEKLLPHQNRKFVGKFEYHILFTKEQEEKLSLVFDEEDILPGNDINKDEIRTLLIKHARPLRLSIYTIGIIKNTSDFIGEKIVNRAYNFYKKWDGTSFSDLTEGGIQGFSRSNLVLCLDFSFLSHFITFKYLRIYTAKEYPDELDIISEHGESVSVYQYYNEYSSPILEMFKDLDTDIELRSDVFRWKFNWKKGGVYVFKRDQFKLKEWVQIHKITYSTGMVLILCNQVFLHKLNEDNWLDNFEDDAKIYQDNANTKLPFGWTAVTIKNVIEKPHPSLKELQLEQDSSTTIIFDKTFYKRGTFFRNTTPRFWVEGAISTNPVCAQYLDDTIIPLRIDELFDYEDGDKNQFYSFTEEHFNKVDEEFKLICGEIKNHLNYKISDFKKFSNNELDGLLPKRNEIGQIIENEGGYIQGLDYCLDSTTIQNFRNRQDTLSGNVFYNAHKAKKIKACDFYDMNHKGNILLHYISTKGRLSVAEFNKCVFSLYESEGENIKKKANYLRYDLQDLGFLDYNSLESEIIVNKSHFVIKPTVQGVTVILVGARDQILVNEIIEYCGLHSGVRVDILNHENKMLPQIVYVKFKDYDHTIVSKFARDLNVLFKIQDLYVQYVLSAFFGVIETWRNYIFEIENAVTDFEGGEIFDINTLKFVEKTKDFNKDLALTKFFNINGYKTILRLWYNHKVYNIKNQQYGIYLVLYLYRKKYEDDYKDCLAQYSARSCSEKMRSKNRASKLTSVLLYDPHKKYLATPVTCKLPRYLTNSLTLLSGHKPLVKHISYKNINYNGPFIIYRNVHSKFAWNLIIPKLNLGIIQTDIDF